MAPLEKDPLRFESWPKALEIAEIRDFKPTPVPPNSALARIIFASPRYLDFTASARQESMTGWLQGRGEAH